MKPGDAYSFVATVRNDGPGPITLLGRPAYDGEPEQYGLAMLRDQNSMSADAGNLTRFEPVALAPGASIAVAFLNVADGCADPAASADRGHRWAGGYALIFEVLGWRRTGTVWPHASIYVAGCE